MKKVQLFEFHIDSIEDWNWFFYENEEEELIAVRDDLEGAATHFGVGEDLVEQIDSAIQQAVGEIISNFKQDLIDLYNKIENQERDSEG